MFARHNYQTVDLGERDYEGICGGSIPSSIHETLMSGEDGGYGTLNRTIHGQEQRSSLRPCIDLIVLSLKFAKYLVRRSKFPRCYQAFDFFPKGRKGSWWIKPSPTVQNSAGVDAVLHASASAG